jgi:hypothetical protein
MAYTLTIHGDKHQEDPENPVEYSADDLRKFEDDQLEAARELVSGLEGVGSATFNGDFNPGLDVLNS